MSKLQTYINITTNATTVASKVPCRLVKIINNKPGASANTATVYDNTAGSGTKIATIDTTQAAVSEWGYDCNCDTGLTVVTATGTAPDLTVIIGPYQDESA
jgi:hypothetical protein